MSLDDLYKKVFTYKVRLCKYDLLYIDTHVNDSNREKCKMILKQCLLLNKKSKLTLVK